MENKPDPQTEKENTPETNEDQKNDAPENTSEDAVPQENNQEVNQSQENSEQQTPADSEQGKKYLSREEYVKRKKKRFYKMVRISSLSCLGLILLTVLITIVRSIYIKNKDKFVILEGRKDKDLGVVVITEEEEVEEDNWETYSNDKFRFSFNYPKEDRLVVEDPSEEEYIAKIIFKDAVPQENLNGDTLVDGYIFSVNPLALSKRNINAVTSLKREWFVEFCPDTAEVSKIKDVTIDNIPGKRFEIVNCNSDYIVSYVPENNFIYEIIQTYKGDLGFRQTYKSQTNLIADSLIIYEEPTQIDPITTFENMQYKFSFKYPTELDSQCCKVAEPPIENTINFITLSTGNPEEVVGFFATYKTRNKSFEETSAQVEAVLIDDYKVIKGKPPSGEKISFEIDGEKAVRFSGYSWKGNDLILVYLPSVKNTLIISIRDFPEDLLDSLFDSMKIQKPKD